MYACYFFILVLCCVGIFGKTHKALGLQFWVMFQVPQMTAGRRKLNRAPPHVLFVILGKI